MNNLFLTTNQSPAANSQPEEFYDGYFEEFFNNGLLRRRGIIREGYKDWLLGILSTRMVN
jgi:hypothetical protein